MNIRKLRQNGIAYDEDGQFVHSHIDSLGASGNIEASTGSTFTFENKYGQSTVGFYLDIGSPSGGEVVSEISFDGTHWEPASMRCMADDTVLSTLHHTGNYIGSIAGAAYWRLRVTSQLGSVGTVHGRADSEVAILENIEFNAAPHKVGHPITHHDKTITSAVTGEAVWTPATGKKIVLTKLIIVVFGSIDGNVEVFQNGGGEGNRFFNATIAIQNQNTFALPLDYSPAVPFDQADSALKVTTNTNISVSIMATGYEI